MEYQSSYELTKEGLDQLKRRLREAEEKLRKLLSQKQETVVTQGDYWHDNPTFNRLEMEERALRLQIMDIRDKLARAIVVEENTQENEVKIGSLVTIIFKEGGEEMEFTIVDPETSNPSRGLISYASPLGKAILGARVGNTKIYFVGERKFQVKVLKIGRKNDGQK